MTSQEWSKRALGALGVAGMCFTGQASAEPDSGPATVMPGGTASGWMACVDPETGELVSPEENPDCIATGPTRDARSRYGSMPEVPDAGGGMMVTVPEAFMAPLVATIGEDGQVELDHVPAPESQ